MKCKLCGNDNKFSKSGNQFVCLVCGAIVTNESDAFSAKAKEYKSIIPKYNSDANTSLDELSIIELREAGLARINDNFDEARKYLHAAALKGDKISQYKLCLLFERKEAYKEKAYFWLSQAAAAGLVEAKNYLKENYSDRVKEISLDEYGQKNAGMADFCKELSRYIVTLYCCSPIRTNVASSGTGFVLNNGLIVTNNHVITYDDDKTYSQIVASFTNNIDTKSFYLDVIRRNEPNDIALLKFSDSKPAHLMGGGLFLSNSNICAMGDRVVTIGNGLSFGLALSTGYVAQQSRHINLPGYNRFDELLQLNMEINHGNSGGPVVNMKKEVVGISTLSPTEKIHIYNNASKTYLEGDQSVSGVCFATTSNSIKKLL